MPKEETRFAGTTEWRAGAMDIRGGGIDEIVFVGGARVERRRAEEGWGRKDCCCWGGGVSMFCLVGVGWRGGDKPPGAA